MLGSHGLLGGGSVSKKVVTLRMAVIRIVRIAGGDLNSIKIFKNTNRFRIV